MKRARIAIGLVAASILICLLFVFSHLARRELIRVDLAQGRPFSIFDSGCLFSSSVILALRVHGIRPKELAARIVAENEEAKFSTSEQFSSYPYRDLIIRKQLPKVSVFDGVACTSALEERVVDHVVAAQGFYASYCPLWMSVVTQCRALQINREVYNQLPSKQKGDCRLTSSRSCERVSGL